MLHFFQNSNSCRSFLEFIEQQLIERVRNGSLRICLYHDERYLNLWIKDVPFQLETLKDVHRLVSPESKMICCDVKSGYDHVRLTQESQIYFGVQFCGWVFSYTTLPFG